LRLALIAAFVVGGCISPPPPSTGGLIVSQRPAAGISGVYIEGAIAFVELRDADGAVIGTYQHASYLSELELMRADLAPGAYELRSYVRSCSGNCSVLDPPTDECTAEVSIDAGAVVEVLIVRDVGQPCSVVTGP
jgi:hypothetical protein